MKKWIVSSMLVTGLLVADAGAQKKRDVNQALQRQYPEAKTEVIGEKDVNGVKVQEVRVRTEGGESIARITEYGDFLISGSPTKSKALPPTVSKTYQNLFGEAPRQAESFAVTNYVLNLDMDGKTYRAVVDATGRIRNISRGEEIRWQEPKGMNEVTGDDRQRVEKLAEKHLDGGKVQNVYRNPEVPGFFLVEAKTSDGQHSSQLLMNERNELASERTGINAKELPKPVQETVDRMFKNSQIKDAYRLQYEYYQFEQPTKGGDVLVIKVRSDGDVMDARSSSGREDEEAVTAAAKSGRGDKKGDNNRGDRGN